DGEVSPEGSLFTVLDGLPLGGVFSVIAIVLVVLFFITSSDSGSLVQNMLTAGGHPNPPTWSRVLFSVLEGAIAIGLLLAGGLEGLQAASLATALTFSVIMVLMAVAVYRGLRLDSALSARSHLCRRMRMFSELVGVLYDLPVPDARALLEPEPLVKRLSRTTRPRLRHRRGPRVDEIRTVQ